MFPKIYQYFGLFEQFSICTSEVNIANNSFSYKLLLLDSLLQEVT